MILQIFNREKRLSKTEAESFSSQFKLNQILIVKFSLTSEFFAEKVVPDFSEDDLKIR
jgi:hypothetical protein